MPDLSDAAALAELERKIAAGEPVVLPAPGELLAALREARTQLADDRTIAPGTERCPECGGHDGRPNSHCSPACQCRDQMRQDCRHWFGRAHWLAEQNTALAEQNTALAVRVQEAWAIAEDLRARLTEATRLMLVAAPLLANPGDRVDLVRAAGRLAPSDDSEEDDDG